GANATAPFGLAPGQNVASLQATPQSLAQAMSMFGQNPSPGQPAVSTLGQPGPPAVSNPASPGAQLGSPFGQQGQLGSIMGSTPALAALYGQQGSNPYQ